MTGQISMDETGVARDLRAPGEDTDHTHEVANDLAYMRLGIVNVAFVGPRDAPDRGWVLIDTGIPGSAEFIVSAAARRFGPDSRPSAIVLTHGHFDHVGALKTLTERWDVPVYAHVRERPYLDGSAAYPAPDPSVGGGLMARLSPLFPRDPIDVTKRFRPLPADGSIPGMAGWRWLHTPGHSPGHVSFWRESDRALIAGDAFISTRQESAYAVAMQVPELHGPPMYFTPDWRSAHRSVEDLAELAPDLAVTGHGPALHGEELRRGLRLLARDFRRIAMPRKGRYVGHPARAEDGSAYRRPGVAPDPVPVALLKGAVAGLFATWVLDRVDWFLYGLEPEAARRRTWAVRPGHQDPAHVLATRVSKALGGERIPDGHPIGLATHYAIGMAPAMLYGALRGRVAGVGAAYGLGLGAAMSVLEDEVMNPALGLAAPPLDYPWQDHARGLASHLVYGVTTDAVLRVISGTRD